MYADDLLLLSISIADLQQMINVCQAELQVCHLTLSVKKSVCMRIGPQHEITHCSLFVDGKEIYWVKDLKLFGIAFHSGCNFKVATLVAVCRSTSRNCFVLLTAF